MNRAQRSAAMPPSMPSLLRGVYSRVARKLKIDPSYVSRVARGERNSDEISRALQAELVRISSLASLGGNGRVHSNGHARVNGGGKTKSARKSRRAAASAGAR
jgi:hypothetical protein